MIALGILAVLGAAGLTAAVVDVGDNGHDSGEDDQYDDMESAAYKKDTGDTGDESQAAGIDDPDLDDGLIKFGDVNVVDDPDISVDISEGVVSEVVVCRPLDPEDVPISDPEDVPTSDPEDVSTSDDDDVSTSDDDDLPSDDDDQTAFSYYNIFEKDEDGFTYSADLNAAPTEGDDAFRVIASEDQPETLDEPLDMLDGNNYVGLKHVMGNPSQTSITGGDDSDDLEIASSTNLSINTGDGIDYVDIRNSSNVTIDLGDGIDQINLTDTNTNLSINTGAGDDFVYMYANLAHGHNLAESEIPKLTLGDGADMVMIEAGFVAGHGEDGADIGDDYNVATPIQIMDFDPYEDLLSIDFNHDIGGGFPEVHDVTVEQVALSDASGYRTDLTITFEPMEDADPDAPPLTMAVTIFSQVEFDVTDFNMDNSAGPLNLSHIAIA